MVKAMSSSDKGRCIYAFMPTPDKGECIKQVKRNVQVTIFSLEITAHPTRPTSEQIWNKYRCSMPPQPML